MRSSKFGLTRRSALTAIGSGLALPLASPWVRRARAGSGVVNVYNWADYIGETTAADFTAETGIEVVYDTYASAEEMQAKMLAGSTGYDVVFMASSEMPRFIPLNIYTKLDKSKLPGLDKMDPNLMKILETRDPGGNFGVPYMWGSVGFTFNVDMVKERIPDADFEDLGTIFNPENAAKLADCGISILDSPTDIMPIVLKYLGLDGDTKNLADYDKVAEAFAAIRPYIATFDNANYLTALPNAEICVANNWSGDYATAQARAAEAGIEINLAYYVPKTGAPLWFDMMCMPSDAPNAENAYAFLAYMLRPEVIAACTNWVNYANPNLAANEFVDPAVLANPAVYPDETVIKRLWAMELLSPEQDRAITRAWSSIKAG
jgi:putrescine transport system substrate-binding protein